MAAADTRWNKFGCVGLAERSLHKSIAYNNTYMLLPDLGTTLVHNLVAAEKAVLYFCLSGSAGTGKQDCALLPPIFKSKCVSSGSVLTSSPMLNGGVRCMGDHPRPVGTCPRKRPSSS